jgi:heme exporter protein A
LFQSHHIKDASLTASGLGHRFGRNVLFRELTFELKGGQSIAIVGSNGSGKSTLLQILAGLLTPVRGEVLLSVDGELVERERRPHSVGMIAPYLQVYDGFSAAENLRFLLKARGLTADAEEKTRHLLTLVGLDARADDFVGTFSSGMKQRVKVAAALVSNPPVLVFDEPTTNLDDAGRAIIDKVTDSHLSRGGVLIVATNDSSEAEKYGDRVNVEDFR